MSYFETCGSAENLGVKAINANRPIIITAE
jgi:hypothetical protein